MNKCFLLFLFCLYAVLASAQDTARVVEFSLKQSVEYAFNNQPKVLNARLDEEIAAAKVKELSANWYPQVSSTLDIKDYLEIPTTLIPASAFSLPGQPVPPAGLYIPLKFGLPDIATASIDASQLIFDGSYIVGVQASKTYVELAHLTGERSKIETAIAVSKAYYNVLITEERALLIDANTDRLGHLLHDTKALNENGFAEKIDVDRVQLNYNNSLSDQQRVRQLLALSYCLLKFQMGMDLRKDMKLSDKLTGQDLQNLSPDLGSFSYESRIEYGQLQSQLKLNQLDLRRNKLARLPTISAYGTLASQAQRDKFNYLDLDQSWYGFSLIGAKISVSLFGGFQKNYRIQQSRMAVEKSENDLKSLVQSIDVDRETASVNLKNSLAGLRIQKENMALAEEVVRVSRTKYEQGVGSNLEVIDAEAALKEAQTNYYSALYDAYVSKIDFVRANGNFKF